MKTILAVIVLSSIGFAKEFKPSEVQRLRLELLQKDASIAQLHVSYAQQKLNEALQLIYKECVKVRQENNWPEDVGCDVNSLDFKQPEKPKEEKK